VCVCVCVCVCVSVSVSVEENGASQSIIARMKRDSFPFLHPADVFNELAGHKSLGQYAWKVFPMGLCTARSVFARMMQKVLKPLLGVCATTYLDDIGLNLGTITSHSAHFGQTLEALKQRGLFANFSKCVSVLKSMEFWGRIVSQTGIEADPSRVSAI
jgi:hypothetical protein